MDEVQKIRGSQCYIPSSEPFRKHNWDNQIKDSEMGCTLAWMKKKAHMVLAGKPEGLRSRGTPKHRWEDNINKDL
jgi:hypothetical protein